MVLYTDDTNIFVEYMEENALKLKLESVMKQLKVLFLNKELILNITKKSAMSFLSSQCRHPWQPHISYYNNDISYCSALKFLGMNITENLNWYINVCFLCVSLSRVH